MREAIAFKRIFADSQLSSWEFCSLLLSNIGMDLVSAARSGVLLRRLPEICMFRAMQYWGTYRGMNHRSPLTQQLIMQFYYPGRPRQSETASTNRDVLQGGYDTPRR
jgi:hypothetical protein